MNKILLVARREFLTRVQKKTFLLSTIGLPLIIFGLYAMMIYFSVKSTDNFKVAVSDNARLFNGKVDDKKSTEIIFEFVQDDTAALKSKLDKGIYDAYLYVPAGFNAGSGKDSLQIRSGKAVGLLTREKIQSRISKSLEDKRLMALNISQTQIDSIKNEKDYIRFSSTSGETQKGSKVGISYAVGMISGFLIYIILFVYGTMVMRGVMEEKVSRIAEVIVSSVKPFQLMMGKILGIGSVGLLQFIIWIVLVFGLQIVLPAIFPEMAGQQQAMPVGPGAGAAAVQQSGAMATLMSGLQDINFPLIIGCFVFYFLGGYFLYSSLFAAVGSAVNEDPQDAQSLLLPIMMPVIFALVIMTKAVNDPNSSLAVFGSLFPLTSPIVMMARIAHGIPDGVSTIQLIISMLLLIGGFLGTTWLAGKIYRTGILMYGKKVTWKEMWKWAFRKS
ncbi:ABC transporter permease [Sediminibacterium ginsengisoli]|uniref:ABC-2 type transport system permease protein n=1 Tax=Sediminibacterium ginsengisoli TaxID=413434 RepID=A0A1T4MZ04_9BACT|nr:ABC transporter permease [Sediminibacterium ginsengisoli]SJZ71858.1 ABC-2 type transport system permease protein [Sediminibacterium ginsengisoli]